MTPTDIITARLDAVLELLDLTADQSAAIAGDQMNELMRVLGVKQRLIERFVDLSRSLAAMHVAGQLASLPQHVRRMHRAAETKHAELLAAEADCESVLVSRREGLTQELSHLAVAGRAAASYADTTKRHRWAVGPWGDLIRPAGFNRICDFRYSTNPAINRQ